MRAGSAALAKSPAPAMGRTAAEGIRQPQHRRIRAIVPDRRATAADAGFCRQEAVAGSRHAPRMRGIQYAVASVGTETAAFTGSSAGACHRAALSADPLADDDSC